MPLRSAQAALSCLLLAGCANTAPPSPAEDAVAVEADLRDSASEVTTSDAPARADAAAMGPSDADADANAAPDGDASSSAAAQLPPQGRDALEAWLAAGYYRAWRCEPAEHAARSGSAHLANRICSNDLLAASNGVGVFPAGVASVKELYDRVGGTLVGYAVAVKLQADSRNGAGWYWYERVRSSVYADGAGVSLCTGCHSTASSAFAPDSRDFVFTRVP